jgi:hypothetical protein
MKAARYEPGMQLPKQFQVLPLLGDVVTIAFKHFEQNLLALNIS